MSALPERTPVRQSLLRPHLLFGGERELVLMTGMIFCMTAFATGISLLLILPVLFLTFSLAVLPRMAKHDPQLSRVYVRHVNKKTYYPAAAHFIAAEPEPKKHQ